MNGDEIGTDALRRTTAGSRHAPRSPAAPRSGPTRPMPRTRPRRARAEARSAVRPRTAIEWTLLIVAALVIALLVKTFFFQAFYIPSDSMVPTLKKNDRVIVNKLSYKLHRCTAATSSCSTRPKGADGKPIDPTIKDLVKRVIGLPGETVSEKNGHILIDGKPLNEPYLPAGTVSDCASFQAAVLPDRAPRYRPLLGDGRQPRGLARLALLRRDHEERDRRPRVRADLAAEPARTSSELHQSPKLSRRSTR